MPIIFYIIGSPAKFLSHSSQFHKYQAVAFPVHI